jgi:hypothetical protein
MIFPRQMARARNRSVAELLVKVLTIVAMTHGLRALSGVAGPRWGGLVLGLPCSTAVVLFFFGRERGVEFAVRASQHSLLGLGGAVALALVYALLSARGWRLAPAMLAAGAAYFLVAGLFLGTAPAHLGWAVALSTAAVAGSCLAARRLPLPPPSAGWLAPRRWRALTLRTVVPAVCVVSITGLAEVLGHRGAGLMSTFPATFLAVLVVTHLESGARSAAQMAKSYPQGTLSMIGFITVFRLTSLEGLYRGVAWGYAAALATLLVAEGLTRLARRQDQRLRLHHSSP